jgi:hypothetical protein
MNGHTRADYDFTELVVNWEECKDPNDEDFPYYVDLGVIYTIVGSYTPATWGYWGGDPPEYPEIGSYEVYNADTGEKMENLPREVTKRVKDAIWKDVGRAKRSYKEY